MRVVKIVIPEELYKKIEKEAEKRGQSVSEFLSKKVEKELLRPQKSQESTKG